MGRTLVTGASGYIGGHLIPELLTAGHEVRAMVRKPASVSDARWLGDVEIATADALDERAVRSALDGVSVAYYLIHSMGSGRQFESIDRRSARIFGRAACEAEVERIVYLGALHPDKPHLSAHLESRRETGEELIASGVPTTVLQAGIAIGHGSASYEMMRQLTERLPAMVGPRWLRNRIQPIATPDLVHYLVGSASMPPEVSRGFDVGGPDILTFKGMMQRYAEVAGRWRPPVLTVPVMTPWLASHWVGLITDADAALAKPLVGSLSHEVVVQEHDIDEYVPRPAAGLMSFDDAVRQALADAANDSV